jgi:hypothetical protein
MITLLHHLSLHHMDRIFMILTTEIENVIESATAVREVGHIMIMLLHLLLGGMIALQVFLCRLFTKELLRVFSLLDLLQCRIFQLIVVEPVLSQFLQSRQLINQQVFFR